MNYKDIYENLINRGINEGRIKRRKSSLFFVYYENHHILPKCLGGTNNQDNLVLLTPEEHFLAHQLLVKIYPYEYKLLLALLRMSGKGNRYRSCNNKLYGWIKRRINEQRVVSKETRLRMSLSAKSQSAEKKAAISVKLKGRISPNKGNKYTDEQKAQMSKSNKGKPGANLGKTFSEETKRKMSEAKKGIPKSEEHKRNMSIAQQARNSTKG